ncbi:MAG: hypothetical protein Q9214_006285 [Letrouitia sp. 1 TL-2023]
MSTSIMRKAVVEDSGNTPKRHKSPSEDKDKKEVIGGEGIVTKTAFTKASDLFATARNSAFAIHAQVGPVVEEELAVGRDEDPVVDEPEAQEEGPLATGEEGDSREKVKAAV